MSLIAIIATPLGVIVGALLTYIAGRALRAAQTRRTDSETRRTDAESGKTEAEAWSLLTGGLTNRLAALETENGELRTKVRHLEERAQAAETEARSCRLEVERIHELLENRGIRLEDSDG